MAKVIHLLLGIVSTMARLFREALIIVGHWGAVIGMTEDGSVSYTVVKRNKTFVAMTIYAVQLLANAIHTKTLTLSVLKMALAVLYYAQEAINSIYNISNHFFSDPCLPLIKRILLDRVLRENTIIPKTNFAK